MPSQFETIEREELIPEIIDMFAERKPDETFEPVSIKLFRSQFPFEAPEAVVGELTVRQLDEGGTIVQREAVTVDIPTAKLVTGIMPLPERTQVTIPKYGDVPFHPFPDECKYGGVMTLLSLVRLPVNEIDSFQRPRAG